jgi:hypothetical protein
MNSLKALVREHLKENLYEATVVLRSSRDFNITIIADNIRGICGITVCTIAAAARPVSNTHERTELKIKFHKLEPTMEETVIKMSNAARKIDGVSSFIVARVERVFSRIYR